MRELVLDTETTGLDPKQGHRIVEIAAVELINKIASGAEFHVYLDPERDMPDEAFRIHGLSKEFLTGKSRFAEIADEFGAFIGSDPLVIHNAEFDIKFLNAELERVGRPRIEMTRTVDTLLLARKAYGGGSNSLDALCARYGIDLSRRIVHGALLDCQLLAEVYLELCGSRQSRFELRSEIKIELQRTAELMTSRANLLVIQHDPQEQEAHAALVKSIGERAIWNAYSADGR